MGRGQALSYEDYIPYEGPRVAGFSPEQLGAQAGYKALAQRGMPLLDKAGQIASIASQGSPLMAQSGYQAAPISSQYAGSNIGSRFRGAPVRSTFGGMPITSQYQAGPIQSVFRGAPVQSTFGGMPIRSDYRAGPIESQYRAGPIRSTYGAAPIRTGVQGWSPQEYLRAGRGFGERQAQQYMSPYLENVMERQQKRALDRFQEGKAQRGAQAIKSGAFGGSRQAVGDFLARRDISEKLGDIEAQQLEKGYASAQQQFERDRAARMGALQAGDTGQLALAKQRAQEQIATEEAKRQAAAQNLQAQIAQQKAFEAAGGQGLQAQIAADKAREAAGGQRLQAQIAQMKGLSDADARRLQAQIAQGKFGEAAGAQYIQAQSIAEKARQAAGEQNLQAQIAQMKGLSDADARRIQAQIAQGKFGEAASAQDLQAQIARDKTLQAAQQYNLQAQIAADKARQQQGAQSLEAQLANQRAMEAAYGRGLKGAGVLGDLTKTEQALDLQRLKGLSDVGTQRQGMMQRAYDTAYEDFIRQKEYPYEQLERFSGMLQGLPVTPSYTQSLYSPRPDPTASLLQTGLGAYGMGRGMGMFGGG
jgi:hypothetical protein